MNHDQIWTDQAVALGDAIEAAADYCGQLQISKGHKLGALAPPESETSAPLRLAHDFLLLTKHLASINAFRASIRGSGPPDPGAAARDDALIAALQFAAECMDRWE